MKFSTLMKIRNVITDKMLEVDAQIDELKKEAAEMKESGNYYDSETDKYSDQYEFNMRQCSKLRSKYLELKDILSEVEATELK